MFAYCNNNPVNYVDPTGMLRYPGEIHNQVVKHIADKYLYNTEQIILYKSGGFGRADLINNDGKIWEVKRDKPLQIAAGQRQVAKYAKNIWKDHSGVLLDVGGDEIEPDTFFYTSGSTTYRVTYRYAGSGVIAYDYRAIEFDAPAFAAAGIAAVAILSGIVSGLLGRNPAYQTKQ